jgi:integron integrase
VCLRCHRSQSFSVKFDWRIRTRHLSPRTEEAYVGWIKRFIFFNGKRHPAELGEVEIGQFLSSLATTARVSASTQNQALNALLLLYQEVFHRRIGLIEGIVRAKRQSRLPVVLTKDEVMRLLSCLEGISWLMAVLLYGAGLRLMECCRLRVKDIEFSKNQIVVRAGKGNKDRYTMLPTAVKEPLLRHLQSVKHQHDQDLGVGLGRVSLPNALERKYPNAGREWGWQWVFPATSHYTDRLTGERRRHHLHESVLQKSVKTPDSGLVSRSRLVRTLCVIPLRRTCWKMATTSAPFRSYWDTAMSARL